MAGPKQGPASVGSAQAVPRWVRVKLQSMQQCPGWTPVHDRAARLWEKCAETWAFVGWLHGAFVLPGTGTWNHAVLMVQTREAAVLVPKSQLSSQGPWQH